MILFLRHSLPIPAPSIIPRAASQSRPPTPLCADDNSRDCIAVHVSSRPRDHNIICLIPWRIQRRLSNPALRLSTSNRSTLLHPPVDRPSATTKHPQRRSHLHHHHRDSDRQSHRETRPSTILPFGATLQRLPDIMATSPPW